MRKLLVSLIFLIVGVCAMNAQTLTLRAYAYCYKVTGYSWTDWQGSNVTVVLNTTSQRITIDSSSPQIIDYGSLTETDYGDYTLYEGFGSDITYQIIGIKMYVYNDGTVVLKITYSDLEYKYKMISVGVEYDYYPKSEVDFDNNELAVLQKDCMFPSWNQWEDE